jgi:hypothetical protein
MRALSIVILSRRTPTTMGLSIRILRIMAFCITHSSIMTPNKTTLSRRTLKIKSI